MYIKDMIVFGGLTFMAVATLVIMFVMPIWMVVKVRKFKKEEEQEILSREGAI